MTQPASPRRRNPSRRPARIRVRVLSDSTVAIGPGKAELLVAIDETGSISAAARAMGMSYRRAWLLVDTMNHAFRSALIVAAKGGSEGGGATLTLTGRTVLREYRALAEVARKKFEPLLAPSS